MELGGLKKPFSGFKVDLAATVVVLVVLCSSRPAEASDEQFTLTAMLDADGDNSGFINIDCGAETDYYDEELGLLYKTDAGFIDTGINRQTSPRHDTEKQWKNVRSFPNGVRNCYTLRATKGKNKRYIIRTSFVYGNYDGRNENPIFDLYLGVNKWLTLIVDDPSARHDRGIIHVPSTDYIDLCLVNTGFGVPFVSVVELRPLESAIYENQFRTLIIQERLYFEQPLVRYPDDIYDRLWRPTKLFPDSVPISSNSSISGEQGFNDTYKLPNKVLESAAQSSNASTPLAYSWTSENSSDQWFFYLFINEVKKFEQGKQREMIIDINNEVRETSKLEYLKPITVLSPSPLTGATINFTISAQQNSDLPPILNAFEILKVMEFTPPTADNDVYAVKHIKNVYNVTRDSWQGDPCVPMKYLWEGLSCSYNDTPRIVSLNLSSSNLIGQIAASLANLTAIQELDLSYNNLHGTLPEFLAWLPLLKVLKLRGNNLSGPVPDALKEKYRSGKLQLSVEENSGLCPSDVCPVSTVPGESRPSGKKYVVPLVASIVSALVLTIFCAGVAWKVKRRKQDVTVNHNKREQLISRGRQFSYSEIVNVTNNFDTTIGEGGFGKVYYGKLCDRTEVAVKVLSSSSKQGYEQFQAEAQLLLIIHHRDLVPLIGYCDEGENKALIYEYMANGNLRRHLLETSQTILGWKKRLQIAVDAAQGLDYLHDGCKPSIIHRDLKTSNILLDKKLRAKIADFGLSTVFKRESQTHLSTKPAGTHGYVDPEYGRCGKLTKKSDIYSFGVILLELITGQPAILAGDTESTHIVDWIHPMIERGDIRSIMDSRLEGKFNQNSAWKSIEVAMACVASAAIQRPNMSHVLAELKECLKLEEKSPEKTHIIVMSNSLQMTAPSAR